MTDREKISILSSALEAIFEDCTDVLGGPTVTAGTWARVSRTARTALARVNGGAA